MRLNARNTVVLPLPDEPMKAVISCSCTAIETSVTALKALYQIETFFRSKITSPGADPACGRAVGSSRGRLVIRFGSGDSIAFLARVSGESCGNNAGGDHEDEGDRNERERRAPAAALGAYIRR